MSRVTRCSAVTLLLLGALSPQLLRAVVVPFFDEFASLSYSHIPNQGTSITSSVRATLYDGSTSQRLISQVIMGHGVADTTTQMAIHEKRVVSEVGDASEQVTKSAVLYHCYETDVAAHANAYNLHRVWVTGPVCPEPYNGPDPNDTPKDNCPVLLDLQQDGFHLSAPDPAVRFDINADGTLDEIAWTEASGDDAFLCWDRNRNGVIDDGRELFGYATPLVSGRPAKVGYRALAELDEPELGGDGNGKVDAEDLVFRELRAWVDENRDGVSQSAEIRSLEEVGVVALEYRYKPTRLWDTFGNLFRYVSSVEMQSTSGSIKSWPTFDVIFAEQ